MNKKEIIKKLSEDNSRKGSNSMGISESWYSPFYLTNAFFKQKKIDPKSLKEEELNLLLDLAEYAGNMFY